MFDNSPLSFDEGKAWLKIAVAKGNIHVAQWLAAYYAKRTANFDTHISLQGELQQAVADRAQLQEHASKRAQQAVPQLVSVDAGS